MGLDISAYSKLGDFLGVDEPERSNWDSYAHVYEEPGFVAQADGLRSGFYDIPEDTKRHGFRAGSYSGYNRWREHLSLTALGVMPEVVWKDPGKYEGQPFYELIHFSDCEGTIGPKTSARLAKWFDEYRGKFAGHDEWFTARYEDWAKAFAIAAEGGCVRFH